jgi:hypothetical protein
MSKPSNDELDAKVLDLIAHDIEETLTPKDQETTDE